MNAQQDPKIVIDRTVNASIDVVWSMWADAEHFAAWYGPQGASVPVANMDVTPGGKRHIAMEMETPDGPMRMWFVGEYVTVEEPTRLVYTDAMSDEDGNVKTAEEMGMGEGHPTTTEVIVELEEVDGGTRMILTHVGIPSDSPGAMGWNMALDKLETHLASAA